MKRSDTAIRISQPGQLQHVPELEGLKYHSNGEFQFDGRLYTRQMAETVVLHSVGAKVDDSLPYKLAGGTVQAGEADLGVINESHALRTLEAGDVRLYDRYVINDAPTRGGLIFTQRALKKFAADFKQGRTVLMYHDTRQPVGRTFKASVSKATIREVQGNWVKLRLYIPVKDEEGERIQETRFPVSMLDSGVLAFDSIGFGGGLIQGIRVGEGKNERFYLQVDDDPSAQFRLEAGEVSFVFMGQVRGAGNNKQAAEMQHNQGDEGVIPTPQQQGDPGADPDTTQTQKQVLTRWVTY